MAKITTVEAAERLGLSRVRVFTLIKQGRIKAEKLGRDWMIDEKNLTIEPGKPTGRPKKSAADKSKKKAE